MTDVASLKMLYSIFTDNMNAITVHLQWMNDYKNVLKKS